MFIIIIAYHNSVHYDASLLCLLLLLSIIVIFAMILVYLLCVLLLLSYLCIIIIMCIIIVIMFTMTPVCYKKTKWRQSLAPAEGSDGTFRFRFFPPPWPRTVQMNCNKCKNYYVMLIMIINMLTLYIVYKYI